MFIEVIQIGCVIVSQDWTSSNTPTFEMVEQFELKNKTRTY